MDEAALKALKGTVTKVYASHSRKASDGNYGSIGAERGIEFQPAPDANIADVMAVLDAFTKAAVDVALTAAYDEAVSRAFVTPYITHPDNLKANAAALHERAEKGAAVLFPQKEVAIEAIVGDILPRGGGGILNNAPAVLVAKPEPTRVPDGDGLAEMDTFPVKGLRVEFAPSGAKMAKILGGRWLKFGVTVWPEVLATVGLDVEPLGAGDYVPEQLLGKTAVALMDGKKPKKVVSFAP